MSRGVRVLTRGRYKVLRCGSRPILIARNNNSDGDDHDSNRNDFASAVISGAAHEISSEWCADRF